MKKLILTLIALTTSLYAIATVRTVSNHSLGGAQYPSLVAAYNAAANGDTLLIEGTSTSYTMQFGVAFAKSLVVIGQGFNTQKQFFQKTNIANTGIATFGIDAAANGSKFYGINFSGSDVYMNINLSNLLFEDCSFEFTTGYQANTTYTNIVYKNCVFTKTSGVNVSINGVINNMLFTNCIFNSSITGDNTTSQFITIDHCLFLSSGTVFTTLNGIEVKNSIFMNTTNFAGITASNFQNNLVRLSATFPPVGNTDVGGNLIGVDPNFTTYTLLALYSNTQDYHLQAGSLAIGVASDMTDIGVHGGFSKFSERGEPLIIPVTRSMNIINSTVAPNGTINIQINASKPSDN